MVLSFVVSIFTARYLGPANYGIINYIGAYVTFFTSLCTLGINAVIIKDFVENPDDQGQAIGTTIVLRVISSIVSAAMIVSLVSFIDVGETETIIVAGICSIALAFQVFDTFNYWFQSRYQSKITSIASLIAYLVTSVYKIILLINGMSIRWFAFASSADYIVLAAILYAAYIKNKGPKLSFSWDKGKQLIGISYHYILSGVMVAIYGQTDRLMLKHMLDESAVGYYSLAASVNNMWVFVLAAIIDSMAPTIIRLYKEDRVAFEKKNRQLYAIVIYVSIFVAALFMLFGRFAVCQVYGEDFAPAADSLKIICWYTIFSYLGVARNAWVVCENKQKYLKYMYASAAVINVGLNILLIPRWGASGAALASLIAQILTSMILPALITDMRPNVKLMIEALFLKNLK